MGQLGPCQQLLSVNQTTNLQKSQNGASILKDGRVVFNIAGNKYRLVVWINYAYKVVYIRFIGSHAQYEKLVGNEFS